MRITMRAMLLVAVGLASGQALAQTGSEYGSAVDLTKRNCPVDPTVACGGVVQRSRAGGAFNEVDASFAAIGTGAGSTAAASVTFGLPTIKASANALGSVRMGAFVVCYQVFEYTGATDLNDLRLSAIFTSSIPRRTGATALARAGQSRARVSQSGTRMTSSPTPILVSRAPATSIRPRR